MIGVVTPIVSFKNGREEINTNPVKRTIRENYNFVQVSLSI